MLLDTIDGHYSKIGPALTLSCVLTASGCLIRTLFYYFVKIIGLEMLVSLRELMLAKKEQEKGNYCVYPFPLQLLLDPSLFYLLN